MPIVNNLVYEPIISELNSENDIIILLRGVKNELGALCDGNIMHKETLEDFLKKPLREIVSIINEGHYDLFEGKTIDRVDLSKANYFLLKYKYLSERGCQSCKSLKMLKPIQDETWKYCGLSETEKDVSTMDMSSPRVKEYFEKGCDERNPIFRPLEEVLAHQD